jgi:hypothetical protein
MQREEVVCTHTRHPVGSRPRSVGMFAIVSVVLDPLKKSAVRLAGGAAPLLGVTPPASPVSAYGGCQCFHIPQANQAAVPLVVVPSHPLHSHHLQPPAVE